MTGTYAACLHRNQSRSYLNHLVYYDARYYKRQIATIVYCFLEPYDFARTHSTPDFDLSFMQRN